MKIIYVGRNENRTLWAKKEHPDALLLSYDNWDDYGNTTTLPAIWSYGDHYVRMDSIKLMVEENVNTHDYLESLIASGWDGFLPIPKANYLSVPSSISFYQQIEAREGNDKAIQAAKILRDASYLIQYESDAAAIKLSKTSSFKSSLQREKGAIKAYLDGWLILKKGHVEISDQIFKFIAVDGQENALSFNFMADVLPRDINVLIGPNGIGKSQLLNRIIEYWLGDNDKNPSGHFIERPNFSGLIIVAYSPFENFPVDLKGFEDLIADTGVYQHFGIRDRNINGNVELSSRLANRRAAKSLVQCLRDDSDYGSISAWSRKLTTLENVLSEAISFDSFAVEVRGEIPIDAFYDYQWIERAYLKVKSESGKVIECLPINSDTFHDGKIDILEEYYSPDEGFFFIKDHQVVHLSSGQRMFAYMVTNILGAIRRNSLILVDEPELFLHPTLEISFCRMLKKVLAAYKAKAIISTHSLTLVREIPRECVHVFSITDSTVFINNPPFETFGGDIQRISAYAFGDRSVTKPYEEWLANIFRKFGSAAKTIEALGENINEELVIQLRSMENQMPSAK